MKNRSILFLLFIMSVLSSVAADKVKVACVGNSVTFGLRIENREVNCYPAQLQNMLGDSYEVGNFGKSGATLLRNGHRPYFEQKEYKDALAFEPNIVVIHLGLNDTDPRNWPNFREEFITDYNALIDSFQMLPTKPKVFVCRMTPITTGHSRFKSGTRDWFWQIQEKLEVIATSNGLDIIDLHTSLYSRPNLLPDNIHPNKKGAKIIAENVYSQLTGDFGGLSIADVYQSNMVLQRNVPVSFKGKANRGEKVTIDFNGKKKSSLSDNYGNWEIEFPARKVGEPFAVSIETKEKTISLENVVMGDVWICSGQSNMAFGLKSSKEGKTSIESANNKSIRLYNMKTVGWGSKYKWKEEALEKTNDLDFFDGQWEECSPETVKEFSAIGYHFGRTLFEETNVPIGLIHNAKGGAPTESYIDRKSLEFNPYTVDIFNNWYKNDFVQEFCRTRAAFNKSESKDPLQLHPYHPAYLYESGIDPLKEIAIKGVVWYQGESNAHNVEFHEHLFPLLVKSWRNVWGEDLPFYFVQLSSINRPSWDHFRDSQRRLALNIPNCEMAVCSDLGNPRNVHPVQKKQVGERLAKIALHNEYNQDIEFQGPTVENVEFNNNKVTVRYSHAKSLKTNDSEPIRGFEIAGDNETYYPAKVSIRGTSITLSAKQVKDAKFFRYAYTPYTEANLINEAGIPASTYTTEFN